MDQRTQITTIIQSSPIFDDKEKASLIEKVKTTEEANLSQMLARLQATDQFYKEQEAKFVSKTKNIAQEYSPIISEKLSQITGVPTPPQVQKVINDKVSQISDKYIDNVTRPSLD